MATAKNKARIVPAVDRAARILMLIESRGEPARITELADALGASKGTVREILETLRRHGLLERDADTKRYRLGPQLARLGAASRGNRSLTSIARPVLQDLSDRTRENVLLLVPDHGELVIQEACRPRDPTTLITVAATPGKALPMHAGACGKVMRTWAKAKLNGKCRMTRTEQEAVRASGYAMDDQEFMEGIRGVAAPILGDEDRLIAMILLSGIAATLTARRLPGVGRSVRDAAKGISRQLGSIGDALT